MAIKIEKNVSNPNLREWIMPTSTTEIATDAIIASALVMGAPSFITLLGEQSEWQELYKKLDKLETFGDEPAQFGNLLKPIISRFVESFQDPTSIRIVEFWNRMISAQHLSSGSGGDSVDYDGWVSAFCFWNVQGENLNDRHTQLRGGRGYNFDGVIYQTINSREIPPGYASLPTKVGHDGKELGYIMIAGSVGMQFANAGGRRTFPFYGLISNPRVDSVSPQSDWWMAGEGSKPLEARLADQGNLADGTESTKSAPHQQSSLNITQ